MNTFWGGAIAIAAGIFLIRNVGRYPGVEKAAAIIPGFSVTFGLLITAFLVLRLDYSRWVLGGAYLSAVVIFYLGYSHVSGRKDLTIGVLPSGTNTQELMSLAGVRWVRIDPKNSYTPNVEAVTADLKGDLPQTWERWIADVALAGIPVYHTKHLIESLTGRVELEHLSETSFGTLSPPSAYMVPKHALDRVTAAVALAILAPLFLLISALIRIDSGGPAIFRQQRIGFRGKPFIVYKFRTMRNNGGNEPLNYEDAITVDNDHRITRLGKFLRRTRIDELPQILNVLKGEMSWIGPRPEAAILSGWYEEGIPFYRYRHIVRPGITGWAQVFLGHVADIDQVKSKLFYDFYYIKNFSLWIDILIAVKTIRIMISGYGSK
ncbi:sugar transferase [Allosphingosinicella flava]|uniref:Sugar transferase n=1 Tax=Allosphingosinicella flava TaxID=2771430 RepID=A0A7T2GIB8_9SPHN|nr:sugar transferase [Sphingosinicella flava]QPQ54420.1 sugar transferase [Sphingosinicella flava]